MMKRQRCSWAEMTAPLSEFSLPNRLRNFRTVKVLFSFSEKTARISQRVDLILSLSTLKCIFLLFTYVPRNSADREGITWHFSG